MKNHPPVENKLSWMKLDGLLVSHPLIFTNSAGGIVWRSTFDIQEWKPALAAAGLIAAPEPGQP
jgi:hypothetical protein